MSKRLVSYEITEEEVDFYYEVMEHFKEAAPVKDFVCGLYPDYGSACLIHGGKTKNGKTKSAELCIGLDFIGQRRRKMHDVALVWAVMAHELGHHMQREHFPVCVFTLYSLGHKSCRRLLEEDAWRRAERDIIPALPDWIKNTIALVYDQVKEESLRSYGELK